MILIDERESDVGVVGNIALISSYDLSNTTRWGVRQSSDSIKTLSQILRITDS